MDDYGISLPGGVKPEPNVNAALRVLTIHHDLIDTVKVIVYNVVANSWLILWNGLYFGVANTLGWLILWGG